MFFCAWWSFSSKLISSLVLSVVADGTQSLKNIFSLSAPSSAACLNSEPAFPFCWVPVSALAGVRPYLPIVFTSQIAHPATFSALSSFSHCHSLWFWSNPCLLSPRSKSWEMSQFQNHRELWGNGSGRLNLGLKSVLLSVSPLCLVNVWWPLPPSGLGFLYVSSLCSGRQQGHQDRASPPLSGKAHWFWSCSSLVCAPLIQCWTNDP